MSQINFICPHCGHSAVLPASLVGQQGKCPGCQKIVTVTNTPPPMPMPAIPVAGNFVPEPPTVAVTHVSQKSGKAKWWIIGGSSAIVLIALVLFFVLGGDDSANITDSGDSMASEGSRAPVNDLQSLFGGNNDATEQSIEVTTVTVTGQLTNNHADFDLAEDNFSITFKPQFAPNNFVDARCNVNSDGSFSVHSIFATDTNPTPIIFEGLPPGDYRVSLTAKNTIASLETINSISADSDEFSNTYNANLEEDTNLETESPQLLNGSSTPMITIREGNPVVVVNIEVTDDSIVVMQ